MIKNIKNDTKTVTPMSFAEYLQLKNLSAKSVRTHSQRIKHLSDFTLSSIKDKLTELLTTRTPATINKYLQTYRLYSQYLIITNQASADSLTWINQFKYYRETPRQRLVFSSSELMNFLQFEDYYSMYFRLLARTGARPMEIACLHKADLDFANQTLQIQKTKTGDGRTIPIPEDLVDALYQHIQTNDSLWCFPLSRQPDHHLSLAGVRKNFRKRQTVLHLRAKLTPYCLRHTFITRLLSAGVPLFVVQAIVGHKRADTTQKYFHLNMQMQRAGLQRDPLLWHNLSPNVKLKNVCDYICSLGLDIDDDFNFVRTNTHLQLNIRQR
ncbi:site-specific integrase [bacterium]|nr:site-specific integrase [bacterium]